MTGDDPISRLPWAAPMRMIDRIVSCVPHVSIETLKLATGNDELVGSALVLEGMSQSAALLFQMSYGVGGSDALPVLGYVRASHESAAVPGDTIHFLVRARKMTRTSGLFEAAAQVEDRVVSRAEFAMAIAAGPAGPDRDAPEDGS
jgi:3-hydroxymyristoyl/3-hydroxydecanoyl-(acyl carrier protein) dehydratase